VNGVGCGFVHRRSDPRVKKFILEILKTLVTKLFHYSALIGPAEVGHEKTGTPGSY
jgi:hypothetical protein